jgi:putative transposase
MITSCPDDHELQLEDMSTTRSTARSGGVRSLRRSRTTFEKVEDYAAFEAVLEEAREQVDMRLLAFCVLPNHWHLAHGTVGTGPLYQGRFKSFPIQKDEHFFTVCRYVERNALRANLVTSAEQWRWSSLWHRVNRSAQVGTPFGETVWQQATAKRLGLESTLRPPGRPKRLRPDR